MTWVDLFNKGASTYCAQNALERKKLLQLYFILLDMSAAINASFFFIKDRYDEWVADRLFPGIVVSRVWRFLTGAPDGQVR